MSHLNDWRWRPVCRKAGEKGSVTGGKCEYTSKVHHRRHHEFVACGEGLDVGSGEIKSLGANTVDCQDMCVACFVRSWSTLTY